MILPARFRGRRPTATRAATRASLSVILEVSVLNKAQRRDEKRRQIRLASVVAKRLGVKRQNSILFRAVADALGVAYVPGKLAGYPRVMEYARRHGIGRQADAPQPAAKAQRQRPALPFNATDAFLLTFEWRQLRMVVLKKRGARCECCGASPKDGTTVLNIDHVKPRKLFPELALVESNLQVLCGPCNHGKGNWDQTDWREPVAPTEPFRGAPIWWRPES